MRVSSFLPLLPALAVAEQIPLGDQLKGWFDKAKSYIPNSAGSPIDAGAAKVAAHNVVYLNKDNWASELTPKPGALTTGPVEWMVLVSGGNKTCYGQCDRVEKAWNESAALLSADPSSPKLAYVNCDDQPILCSMWATGPAAVWRFEFPVPSADQSTPATTLHIVPLNTTTVAAKDITQIHTKKSYQDVQPYEGYFHPFDGILAKLGLITPIGYILYGFGIVPSWLLMVGISFLSRTFMSRRIFHAALSSIA